LHGLLHDDQYRQSKQFKEALGSSIESKQRVEIGIPSYGRDLSLDEENQFGGEKRNPIKVFMGRF
jgi:hypothetical protein